METSKRFNEAVSKLYIAFHKNNLKPLSFQHCAVGTILDQQHYWKEFSDANGSLNLNYVGLVHQRLNRTFNGYSPLELLEIEKSFLQACGYQLPLRHHSFTNKKESKKKLFKGLEAVIAQLCIFDNIPNMMDCSALFDYNGKETNSKLKTEFNLLSY